jgi:hypothetical protein
MEKAETFAKLRGMSQQYVIDLEADSYSNPHEPPTQSKMKVVKMGP